MKKHTEENEHEAGEKAKKQDNAEAAATPQAAGDGAGAGPAPEKKQDDAQAELEAAKQEAAQQKDKYLRLMAEFDNYKKRTSAEVAGIIATANEALICDLLEVVDNFERALGKAEAECNTASYKKGIALIHEKLVAVLKNYGLAPFCSKGEEFDPELHDALMQMDHANVPENRVIEEVQKGYRLRGKVIRHGRVIVSKGANGKAAAAHNGTEPPPGAEIPAGDESVPEAEQGT